MMVRGEADRVSHETRTHSCGMLLLYSRWMTARSELKDNKASGWFFRLRVPNCNSVHHREAREVGR